MTTIYLTKGIPASGKSTWAKNKVRDDNKVKRISKDDLRDMLDNGNFSMKNEGYVLDMRNEMVESALLRGYDVIIDDTNFNDKHWNQMCDIAKRVGDVRVVEIFFSISLKEALKRNQQRDKDVPDHIVERMFEKHVSGSPVSKRDEYFTKAEHPHGENRHFRSDIIPTFIVDLDGTLAIKNGDRGYFDWDRVIEDDPNIEIIDVVKTLAEEYPSLIVVTGRSEESREQCETWLESFEIPYTQLFMRAKNDYRSDTIVKDEIYWDHIHDHYNVDFVIDDRMGVTNMWRSLGIKVLQVDKGTF